MRLSVITFLLIISSYPLQAQLTEKYSYQHFEGTLGNHTRINLHLTRFGNNLTANYETLNGNKESGDISTDVALKGDYNVAGNRITLSASTDINSNLFDGNYTNSKHIKGEWSLRKGEETMNFDLNEIYSGGTIPFKYEVLSEKKSLFNMKGSPEGSILMLFPVPEHLNGRDAFVRHLSGVFTGKKNILPSELKEEMKAAANQFFKTYSDNNLEAYNTKFPVSTFSWDREQTAIIQFNKRNLVSIRYKNFAHTGGKRGLEQNAVFTFDFEGFAPIYLNDLFSSYSKEQLSDLLTETLKAKLGVNDTETLKNRGFYVDLIPVTDNFYLNNEGLGFVYNPYEIAGGEQGIIEVFIQYHKLSPLLKSESIVERLLKK